MKNPVVFKFGGSSFASPEDYHRIGEFLAETARTSAVVAVVSAPPGLTEEFRARLLAVNVDSSDETVGGLLPRADTVGAYLLKASLDRLLVSSRVLTAPELGILTSGSYVRAQVRSVNPATILGAFAAGRVVIVPGGQAVDRTGRQVWLGKNSSDFSAILIAVALARDVCTFFSDVEGVYSCDPLVVPEAELLPKMGYAAALAAAAAGAKVIHHGAVAYARAHDLQIVCRLNRAPYTTGTIISERGDGSVIVPDQRSRVFVFPDRASEEKAVDALLAAHIPIVRTGAIRRHSITVTCGYSTPEATLRDAGLSASETGEKLLSLVGADGRTEVALHPDTKSLLKAARNAFGKMRTSVRDDAEVQHV